MKVVIQRVSSAKVISDGELTGEIQNGLLLFVCLESGDEMKQIDQAFEKIKNLRIFEDDNGKMSLNISQVEGKILSISQFTLSWDGKKGNRPSFDKSMPPAQARMLWEVFNKKFRDVGIDVQTGVFGAHMDVSLTNDGPVTFHLSY